MLTDSIGDFFTRLRNGAKAGQEVVRAPHSKLKERVADLLKQEGFISDYTIEGTEKAKPWISVQLKYERTGQAVLENIRRISKPGHRVYAEAPKTALVRNGVGFRIYSTSHGVMTDKQAIEKKVGGEVLGEVW
jgi:small subunit ribosomal protein S8